MQLRTEVSMMELLAAWDGRESEPLHFREIKKVTGWNGRKTTDMLRKAIEEGYIEKHGQGHSVLYRSKIADYRGYFDALQFLMKVDWISRKNGTVQSAEIPLYSFVHFHVLAYGVPPVEKLTPLEQEMLFFTFSRMSSAFSDFMALAERIRKRQRWEETESLPISVKSPMFSREEGGPSELLNVEAARQIYGDVLWEHIFAKISRDIRFALEKGSLDCTGPIELLNCSSQFSRLALRLAKRIYSGEFSDYEDPDSITTKKLAALERLEDPFGEGSKNLAVVVTPSPEAMEEFANQVGKIVKDTFDVWKDEDFMASSVKMKGETLWKDVFDFGDAHLQLRRDLLKESICDALASMRCGFVEPFDESDRKFMLKDRNLTGVFSRDEILAMISKVEDVARRACRFYDMIEKGQTLEDLRNDPTWFSEEELHGFHLAQNVHIAAEWKEVFGTQDSVAFETSRRSKELDDIAKGYQSKVRKELNKGQAKRKKMAAPRHNFQREVSLQ